MTPARIFRATLLLALAVPGSGRAQEPCVPVYGTLVGGTLTVQSIGWPDLAHVGLLYGGADAVASRRCLVPDSIAPPPRGIQRLGLDLLPLPVRSDLGYRSSYPFDRNNGVVWAGRGLTQSASGGAVLTAGRVRLTVYPTIAYHQNRDFRTTWPGYRYRFSSLDWPQRFGSGPYWSAHPGQSALAVDLGPVFVSAGTENLWWGPAGRYPIILSSTGPGFPHVRMGTARPQWIGVGWLEAGVLWGRLEESAHYDADPINDRRLMTMVTLAYRPSFVPGLALGVDLVQHHLWDDPWQRARDLFVSTDHTDSNALGSLVIDWRIAEGGVRIYSEWAREDHFLDFEDLVTEIDHSQGYLIGLEKRLGAPDRAWRLRGELTRLSRTNTQSERPQPSFFEHGDVIQGHTNRGQLLGSALGPGSNAQFIAVDRTSRSGMAGAYVERIRHNDDAYEDFFADVYGFRAHDTELTLGLYGLNRMGPVNLDWDLAASRRKNRDFIGLDYVSWDFVRESNLALTVSATWQPLP